VCAPGYTGRKRGEVARTRTTVLQAHSYQWLMISGIETIATYHLICGFDARFLSRFSGQRGSIPHIWARLAIGATASTARSYVGR
jgi:hypothetical protein